MKTSRTVQSVARWLAGGVSLVATSYAVSKISHNIHHVTACNWFWA